MNSEIMVTSELSSLVFKSIPLVALDFQIFQKLIAQLLNSALLHEFLAFKNLIILLLISL